MHFSKLEQLIDSMPQRGLPACDLIVTHKGEVVFRRMVGYSDSAKLKPVSDRDLYWIFSATKPLTCVAGMRLWEEGKLDLAAPVSHYLPAFANLRVKAPNGEIVPLQSTLCVEHLFTMTSGLDYNLNSPALAEARKDPHASTLDLVNAMAQAPLFFEPGTHYRYSLCHDVLGGVIEVASGMRLSDYMKAVIFDPLGMTDTGFHPNEEQLSRFGAAYNYNNALAEPTEIRNVNSYRLSEDYDSGGAGLFSSVNDYIKPITALACGGVASNGYRLLRPETIAQMEVNRLCPDALRDFVVGRLYGYGWGYCGRVHINPTVSLSRSGIGEFGWDGAANAFCMVDRAKQTALYLGTQVHNCIYGYNVLHPLIRNLVYEGLEG